jgi:hypothetical protein
MDSEHRYVSSNYQNKTTLFIYYLTRVAVAVAAVSFFVTGQWGTGITTILVLLFMVVPSLLRGSRKMYLPFELDMGIVVFIFTTLFLGHIADFYNRIPFWDKFFLLSVTGYVLIYILTEDKKIKLNMSPGFISFFAVIFSIAMGAVWEIAEFVTDIVINSNYWQSVGVLDTMVDLIADTVGALIFSTWGYFWMRRRQRLPFTPQSLKKTL